MKLGKGGKDYKHKNGEAKATVSPVVPEQEEGGSYNGGYVGCCNDRRGGWWGGNRAQAGMPVPLER
jgi:hypothetical protein